MKLALQQKGEDEDQRDKVSQEPQPKAHHCDPGEMRKV